VQQHHFFTSPLLEPLQQSPDHIFNAAQPIAADLGARRVTASDVDCICAFADRFDHRVAKAVDHIGVVADAAVAPRGGTGQVKSIDTAAMATIYTSAAETTLNSFSLAAINNVENLTFTGVGDFTGTGNTLANTITGAVAMTALSQPLAWLFPKARPYHCGGCYRHHNGGDPAHDA
jgi:hypothetical protein